MRNTTNHSDQKPFTSNSTKLNIPHKQRYNGEMTICRILVLKMARITDREAERERVMLDASPAIFVGINMLVILSIKQQKSWLGYKR